MKVKIWGCRGSLPSSGPENYIYGGNTSCVQVTHGDTCIILDAGSGIQRLGRFLGPEVREIHILLTHLHIDHTMGLGFFLPMYNPNVNVHLWGPSASGEPLLNRLRRYFSPPLFPVRLGDLPNHPIIHELDNEDFFIDQVKIHSEYICHPGPTLGYRLSVGNSVLAYLPDHELQLGSCNFPDDPEWTSGFEIAKSASLLLHDGGYTAREYPPKLGWGHSTVRDSIAFAKMCEVKKLAVFHHEPTRTDEQIDQILKDALQNQKLDFEVEMCAEGNVYEL
ncbi:MBL fold metallo-hydrolase [Algoriphagus lacus]|uniref:MBL fold metallo-hydrolase n=1 Tax=Algoriphagus lacus TaxID=2056311 RepID=A0A418PTW6_9BACT|nr:MBL fold metallo-hydrolase [Algoriphagus lacus]RIW17000.1 MBL fold metallo-hydrolase [Algoriphagus lacus]